MIRTESFSSINTFKRCPLSYKVRYIDGQRSEPTPQMQRGSNVHREIQQGKADTEPTKFAKKFYKKTGKDYRNIADIKQLTENIAEMKLGIKFDKEELIFCEFDDDACFYRGKADLVILYYKKKENLSIAVEKIEIIDWKTGTSSGDRKQLISYAYMLNKMIGCKDIICKFVYLDKEKISRDIVVTEKELQDIETWIKSSVDAIQVETEYPAKFPNWSCNFCPNNEICTNNNKLDDSSGALTFLNSLLKEKEE